MTINSRWSLNESVLTFETKPNRNADVYQDLGAGRVVVEDNCAHLCELKTNATCL